MRGKTVAIVGFEGTKTARKFAEVAIVNQVIERGSFLLIPQREIRKVKARVGVDPRNYTQIAAMSGADIALWGEFLAFDANTSEGYIEETIYDSQIAAEQGDDRGSVKQLIKVKTLEGHVKLKLFFQETINGEVLSDVTEVKEKIQHGERRRAVHLPPRLRFLEELTNRAVNQFFEKHY
jgi:hypothetical protein